MFDQTTKLCDVKYKIVFLGASSVGKSSIIERFTRQVFDPNRTQTVGIDFIMKNVQYEGAMYRLQLWDTAGQEKFKSLVPNYIRDAHCAVFVYDVGRKDTFVSIDIWLELFRNVKNEKAVTILVGNKAQNFQKREVTQEEGQAKADNYSMSYCQTSAKLGLGIEELFQSIIANIRVVKGGVETKNKSSENNESNSSVQINKARLVRINRQKQKQFVCCYI